MRRWNQFAPGMAEVPRALDYAVPIVAAGAEQVRKRKATTQMARNGKRQRSRRVADGKKTTARGGSSRVKSRKTVAASSKPSIGKRLAKIEAELNDDMSYKRYRFIDGNFASCIVAKAGFKHIKAMDSLNIRNAIGSLDIATGTDVSGTTQTNNTQISIKNVWGECIAINSTDTPCYVNIYAVVPKIDTATEPAQHLLNATQDTVTVQATGLPIVIPGQDQFPLISYPSDIPDFKRMWKTVGSVKGYLRAGDLLKLTATIPDFKWSDDWYDDSATIYKRKACLQFMVRIEGDLCFDRNEGTSTNNYTVTSTLPSRVQVKSRGYFDVEYPGNIPVRELEYHDSLDTIANTPTTVGPNVINIQE